MKKLLFILLTLSLNSFGQTAEEYFNNGFSKYNLKDYSGAIADYNNAIRLKPDYADAYNNRGVAMYFLKDMNAACSDWSKAGELGSANALTSLQNYCKQIVEAAEAQAEAEAQASRYEAQLAREAAEESASIIGKQDVRIGNQVWTKTNLNVTTYRNGDKIPQVQDGKAWSNLTTGAWCYYENKTANGTKYGKLYNWYAVCDPRGLAPNGYHIPTDNEWTILTNYLGGESEAGTKMKSRSGWKENGNGTNNSGFNGLPAGCRGFIGGFNGIGVNGSWWDSSEKNARTLLCINGHAVKFYGHKLYGFSVRCIKD